VSIYVVPTEKENVRCAQYSLWAIFYKKSVETQFWVTKTVRQRIPSRPSCNSKAL